VIYIYIFFFINTTCIIKISIYFCSKFLSFRVTVCFTNPDYRLIRMSFPPLLRICECLLYIEVGVKKMMTELKGTIQFIALKISWAEHSDRAVQGMNHLRSLARTLGSWVRIPLEAWMSVCVYSVRVLLCVGSGLATGWSPIQEVLPTV
jgi:hypothetical protein